MVPAKQKLLWCGTGKALPVLSPNKLHEHVATTQKSAYDSLCHVVEAITDKKRVTIKTWIVADAALNYSEDW